MWITVILNVNAEHVRYDTLNQEHLKFIDYFKCMQNAHLATIRRQKWGCSICPYVCTTVVICQCLSMLC